MGIIYPPPVGLGLTDLPNIGGASAVVPLDPLDPPVPASLIEFRSVNHLALLMASQTLYFTNLTRRPT